MADQKKYLTHRLVWLFHYGYFPENDIDHINRNKADNRLKNLREISHSCNMQNCDNLSNNVSMVKGVSFNKINKVWVARIKINNKPYFLGQSKDFDEIVLLRFATEQCLNWGSCNKMTPARKYALENNLIQK